MEDTTQPSFESALEQLQQTVKRLEGGDLSLEEALKSFEGGVKLTRLCQQHLAAAEQRVEILMKSGGEGQSEGDPELKPFALGTSNQQKK